MPAWKPSAQYLRVAEANRQWYARVGRLYDETETCVTDRQLQEMVRRDLDLIAQRLHSEGRAARALDACGGSGNISLQLLELGMDVTICDISPVLLDIFREKAVLSAYSPRIVCEEIGEFLVNQADNYDLIVFSSALHHLEDVEGVLTLAAERLKPSGMLYTVFDPILNKSPIVHAILRLDYFAFKLLKQRSDLLAALKRRAGRTIDRIRKGPADKQNLEITEANLGVLAEYYADQGIDDIGLVKQLTRLGLEVVRHDRYHGGRYGVTRTLIRMFKAPTTFKLLLAKQPAPDGS